MIVKLYAIYDAKTQLYQMPYYAHNKGHAMRILQSTLERDDSMMARFPVDYELYEVGTFDDCLGDLKGQPIVHICRLDDLANPNNGKDEKK